MAAGLHEVSAISKSIATKFVSLNLDHFNRFKTWQLNSYYTITDFAVKFFVVGYSLEVFGSSAFGKFYYCLQITDRHILIVCIF